MNKPAPTPRLPELANRLAMRQRQPGSPVMFQQWRDLLFLHWKYPVVEIQRTLPNGLFVDTFEGKAYLGVVPFFMRNTRPRFLPAVPGVSNFMEMNLRTYVHDHEGNPGVWFYSLDANQPLAVEIARRWFRLPYEHAKMEFLRTQDGAIRYQSLRGRDKLKSAGCLFECTSGDALPEADPASLEFFLIERYRLFAARHGRLWRGAVFHQPYPLCRAHVTSWNEDLLTLNGFKPTGRDPDHIIMSRGVDVAVFPLEVI
jgi:hypothetical protein